MSAEVHSSLVYPSSLGDTLDAINDALFTGQPIPADQCAEAAAWIADRQGLPGAYAGMFAPTENDYAFGALTFTGEPVRSSAATGHVLSEESCAALFHLGAVTHEVRDALKRARRNFFHRLEQSEVAGQWSGVYCCGTCSVALWRHLAASGEPDDLRRIENGLAELRRYRDGKGRWRRFPFFYTLLALSEIDHPALKEEILYAGDVIERALNRLVKADPDQQNKYDLRRQIVLQRVLEKCY